MKTKLMRGAPRARCWSALVALLSLEAISPAVLHAQAPADETVVLPEFSISGEPADRYRVADAISAVRVRAPLLDTPSSITVLTRDMMDDIAPTRVFDVTRYVAGVQDGRGVQFQDRMIIRGFESNGQRTVDNFLQPADADNIDEVVVDRIEVAKGPNAILAPSGAPGGAINIITKSPLFRQQRSVTGLVGLYDAQKLSVDLTGPFSSGSNLAYRLVGSVQDSRRYWAEDARLRGKAFAPIFTYRLNKNTQIVTKVVAAEHWIFREPLLILDPNVTASTDDPYLAPGLSPKSRNGIQPWSHVGTHTADIFSQLTTSFDEHISLRAAVNGRYYYEDSEQEFLSTPSLSNRYNPYTGQLTQNSTWALDTASGNYVANPSPYFDPSNIPVRGDKQWTRRKTGNFQMDLAGNYNLQGISSQTVGGIAVSRQTGYTRGKTGTLPGINLSNPGLSVTPFYPDTLSTHNLSSFTNWQFYVNERLGFFKDRVIGTAGILHYRTNTAAQNALTGAASSVLKDSKNMGSVGILVKPLPNVSVYYNHSTNSSPVIANNLPLWRDGKQHEFGAKSEFFNQRFSVNLAYFEIKQTNVTIPNPERQTNPNAPEQLVADFGNHGYELEVMGSVTKDFSVIATYSHLRMRDSLGRRVRAVADNNAAVLFNYRFSQGELKNLAFNLGVTYSGTRAGDTPAITYTALRVVAQPSFYLKPSYATTIGASYRWKDYVFRLIVDNPLNDKDYIMVAGGRVSGTGLTTAPGTNLKLSTTWNF